MQINQSTYQQNQCLNYSATGHAQGLLKHLHILRTDNGLCDATIIVGKQIYMAHCVVLSACSEYFKIMFCGEMLESISKQVEIQGIDAEVVNCLLEFMYTGEIKITPENVEDLMAAADRLRVPEIVEACCCFLQSQLHPSNCLGIRKFAAALSCTELCTACELYTRRHFVHVVQHEEFNGLESNELLPLLCSESLRIENELQVFKAVMKWIQHDVSKRKRLLVQLLEPVRFPIISGEELFDSIDQQCRDLSLSIALRALLADYNPKRKNKLRKSSTRHSIPKVKPRISALKYLYVIGGYNREPGGCWSNNQTLDSVDRLDSFNKIWTSMPPLKQPRSSHTIETLHGIIYAIGGEDDLLLYDSVEMYDPVEGKWVVTEPMTVPRSGHGSCVFDGAIYVFGGCVGTEISQTIECFSPERRRWIEAGTMLSPRTSFGLVESEGLIYQFGGMSSVGTELRSAESYNPVTKETLALNDMRSRRLHCSVVVIEDNIYVIGGSNARKGALSSVEEYSVLHEKWTTIPSMLTARTGAASATINGLLYVVGGRTVNRGFASALTYLDTVECYDPRNNAWTDLGKMPEARCEAAIGVL